MSFRSIDLRARLLQWLQRPGIQVRGVKSPVLVLDGCRGVQLGALGGYNKLLETV